MISPSDWAEYQRLLAALEESREVDLPGRRPEVLCEQIIESQRRRRFTEAIKKRPLSEVLGDPNHPGFDPIRAAVLRSRKGDLDEAAWLAFLFTHFGKHSAEDYRLIATIYRGRGGGNRLTYREVHSDPQQMQSWLDSQSATFRGAMLKFGNHRKYETLKAGPRGPGDVLSSYIRWVEREGGHATLLLRPASSLAHRFELIYNSMEVTRFGRTAKFDYLTMLGKLGISPIAPGKAYLRGATGPRRGADLLFGLGKLTAEDAERRLNQLNSRLYLTYDVLEDALCNWQKSPDRFISFRG